MVRSLGKQIPRLEMHHPIIAALGDPGLLSSSSSSGGGSVGDEGRGILEAVFLRVTLGVDKRLARE
eukprot:evm.model.NODE_23006_length_12904_cov_26.635927.4